MDCDEARLLLSRRLDAVIEPAEAQALEMHVVSCATCRRLAYFLQAEQAALVDRWPAVAAPHGFAEQVMAALPARPMPRAATVRPLPQQRRSLAAAAALL